MDIINDNQKEKSNDYWDQTETSQSFNTGLTGLKLATNAHVEARKPGETDWFRVIGETENDLTKGLIVKLKIDNIDQDFLVIGPEDFKTMIVDGFKKSRLVYLAYYVTSSGRQGVWPVTLPQTNQHGTINSYVASAFEIMQRAQREWVNMKSNVGDRVYDGWTAQPVDQEMFGEPRFLLDKKEVIKKAFNDRVITPDNYQSNPYVMRVLNAAAIRTGVVDEH
jgi:hypothetical protein